MVDYQKKVALVNDGKGKSSRKVKADVCFDSAVETIKVIDAEKLYEIAEAGLEALVYQVGLEAMFQVFEQDVSDLVGPKNIRDTNRIAYRHGTEQTKVVYGDKKISVRKPRVRTVGQNGHDIPLPSLEYFQNEDSLNRSILTRLLCGISTRKYERTATKGEEVSTVSKSEVSRRFNVELSRLMTEFFDRNLSDDMYPIIMIDGMERGGMTIVAAMGVRVDGKKVVLGLIEGATENNQTVKRLFEDLIDRGLRTDVRRLFVIDGAKALSKAVRDTFGDMAEIQRCQVHKKRNVLSYLPESEKSNIGLAISKAYLEYDYDKARHQLELIADNLDGRYPSAAASMREGLEETLTVNRLQIHGLLRESLKSTNMMESANSTASGIVRRITKWRDGEMLLKHMAAAFIEAERGFRRVKGYKHISSLIVALIRHSKENAGDHIIAM
jgi:transposase-like protein